MARTQLFKRERIALLTRVLTELKEASIEVTSKAKEIYPKDHTAIPMELLLKIVSLETALLRVEQELKEANLND